MRTPGQEQLTTLRRNRERILEVVERAARSSLRQASSVRLVAVTKRVSLPWILALSRLGQVDLGESRPERLPFLAEALWHAGLHARWHMIGHFQRRKLRRTLDFCHVVHSIHSARLLEAMAHRRCELLQRLLAHEAGCEPRQAADLSPSAQEDLLAEARQRGLAGPLPGLLQINVSGEGSKQGLAPEQADGFLEQARSCPLVRLEGLMTIAPQGLKSAALRGTFGELRSLRDRLVGRGHHLTELSMGMSQDFEEAIQEGATMVRIGSALFQDLEAT